MGIINISFNRRLNIFTVLSVILMPPDPDRQAFTA